MVRWQPLGRGSVAKVVQWRTHITALKIEIRAGGIAKCLSGPPTRAPTGPPAGPGGGWGVPAVGPGGPLQSRRGVRGREWGLGVDQARGARAGKAEPSIRRYLNPSIWRY